MTLPAHADGSRVGSSRSLVHGDVYDVIIQMTTHGQCPVRGTYLCRARDGTSRPEKVLDFDGSGHVSGADR